MSIKKIDKFEKSNPTIAVNVLFSNKKSQDIYIARRSGRNIKCEKQVNLLMIVDGEKWHNIKIKNISRLSSNSNGKNQARISLLPELSQRFLDRVSKR